MSNNIETNNSDLDINILKSTINNLKQENKQLLESNKQLKLENRELRKFIDMYPQEIGCKIQVVLGLSKMLWEYTESIKRNQPYKLDNFYREIGKEDIETYVIPEIYRNAIRCSRLSADYREEVKKRKYQW